MSNGKSIGRRGFVKACSLLGGAVAVDPGVLAASPAKLARAKPARLVTPDGAPLRPSDLSPNESYVFHYPYAATPCFLLNLGRPVSPGGELATEDGRNYRWRGGVGPERSVVAFSAICAHKMSYPTQTVSFINYRKEGFADHEVTSDSNRPVIYCCSEGSVYDPADGARVLGGPAPQPLAAIHLDYDENEQTFTATGTYGGDVFARFFTEFGFQLALQHGTGEITRPVRDTTIVTTMQEYCNNPRPC